MRQQRIPSILFSLFLIAAVPAWSQSIQTDGNIETDAQLVSKVATGTAPLAVSSTTMVPGLNADQVDGVEATALALDTDLQNVEAMLVSLQAQVIAPPAQLPETGQKTCWDATPTPISCTGTGQDGELLRGVEWPNPRFTINESGSGVPDGTVTDNLTGLVWLRNANCSGSGIRAWVTALSDVAQLNSDGTMFISDCGDTSNGGSHQTDWRLPNRVELESLLDLEFFSPALSNAAGTGTWGEGDPFAGVSSGNYWSSTSWAGSAASAWYVWFDSGSVSFGAKTDGNFVWPVRGGQ